MTRRSSSPSSSSQTNGSRAKRPKIFRACAACVTSKTRCEDVTTEGCALCRRRGKGCSLAAVASALEATTDKVPRSERSTPGMRYPRAASPDWRPSSSSEIEDLRQRLAAAERRVARTEAALLDVESQLSNSRRGPHHREPRRTRSRSPSDSEKTIHVTGPLNFATLLLYRLDEAMFSVASTREYPDPVARGVVPASHAELAWHAFKARICSVLPLPPFLAVSTPVPVHGFVVLAALHHVQSEYSVALEPLLNESILLAMSGAASVDVMLALLILSLAPILPEKAADETDAPCTPSAFRLIALAYSMGQSLGFESMAEAVIARGQDLNREYFGEHLWTLQLWAAIVNRFAILSLMHGQIATLPVRVADRLPVLARESVEACNRHLRTEASVIAIFEPVARKLCSLEHVDNYTLEGIRSLQTVWRAAIDKVKAFIRSVDQPPSIQRDALCTEFAMGIRIASLTTWIPSPLRDARELAIPCLSCFPAIMTQMLEIVTSESDPSLLPSYIILLSCAALICFRRAIMFVRIAYRSTSLIDAGALDAAERQLKSLGRAPRFFINQANKLLSDLPYPQTWEGAAPLDVRFEKGECEEYQGHDTGPINLPLDFDIMNWDFSLLYPDLSSFSTMITGPEDTL